MFNLATLALVLAAASPSPSPLPTITIGAPKAELHLEVARTEPQREYGLMNRTSMPAHHGMIFVLDGDSELAFWMKDTLIPLDMIYVAADGTVRKVYANVAVVSPSLPDERIPREIGTGKYVIELSAGEAAKDGIAEGVKLNVSGVPGPLP